MTLQKQRNFVSAKLFDRMICTCIFNTVRSIVLCFSKIAYFLYQTGSDSIEGDRKSAEIMKAAVTSLTQLSQSNHSFDTALETLLNLLIQPN